MGAYCAMAEPSARKSLLVVSIDDLSSERTHDLTSKDDPAGRGWRRKWARIDGREGYRIYFVSVSPNVLQFTLPSSPCSFFSGATDTACFAVGVVILHFSLKKQFTTREVHREESSLDFTFRDARSALPWKVREKYPSSRERKTGAERGKAGAAQGKVNAQLRARYLESFWRGLPMRLRPQSHPSFLKNCGLDSYLEWKIDQEIRWSRSLTIQSKQVESHPGVWKVVFRQISQYTAH